MWAGVFLAVFAFATLMTLLYLFEEAVVFSAAMGLATWGILAMTPEVVVASGGESLQYELLGIRYVFVGLALLSAIVLLLDVFGAYRQEDTEFSPEATR